MKKKHELFIPISDVFSVLINSISELDTCSDKTKEYEKIYQNLMLLPLTINEKVDWLKEQFLNLDSFNELAITAASMNNVDLMSILLKIDGVDLSAFDNKLIRDVVKKGHLEVVKYVFENTPLNPAIYNNYLLELAIVNGHADIVKYFLADFRIDPATNNNKAIRLAAAHGHVTIVNDLLESLLVDPTANENQAFKVALTNMHFEVVKNLLEYPKLNLEELRKFYSPLLLAATTGSLKLINKLINLEEYSSTFILEGAIGIALQAAHLILIKYLSSLPEANPELPLCYTVSTKTANSNCTKYFKTMGNTGYTPNINKLDFLNNYVDIVLLLENHCSNKLISKEIAIYKQNIKEEYQHISCKNILFFNSEVAKKTFPEEIRENIYQQGLRLFQQNLGLTDNSLGVILQSQNINSDNESTVTVDYFPVINEFDKMLLNNS